jgi:hypothetical protein
MNKYETAYCLQDCCQDRPQAWVVTIIQGLDYLLEAHQDLRVNGHCLLYRLDHLTVC